MMAITFVVEGAPPWKQIPADNEERKRQADRLDALRQKASESFGGRSASSAECALDIRYTRCQGRADSANIIGGVADGLQHILYSNDRQIIAITYAERPGTRDWYQITVTEVASVSAGTTAVGSTGGGGM